MTLLPSLIDRHVHLTSARRCSGHRSLEFANNCGAVVGVAHAKKALEAGFTTVRSVGARSTPPPS